MRPPQHLPPLERFRLLQLRELAPEEFASYLIEMVGLALLRRKERRASFEHHQPKA